MTNLLNIRSQLESELTRERSELESMKELNTIKSQEISSLESQLESLQSTLTTSEAELASERQRLSETQSILEVTLPLKAMQILMNF